MTKDEETVLAKLSASPGFHPVTRRTEAAKSLAVVGKIEIRTVGGTLYARKTAK